MEPLIYVMAILGCGDAGTGCAQQRIATPIYRSAAHCRADAGNVLLANTDLDFPMIKVDCRKTRKPASYQMKADTPYSG
ncbi:hypothetical protein [Sphingobium boeckii]|uniref:Uncharacterized protein n=1 Tax=Sphingobium boeckii TaxID=1082345 RepID=A0A7W9AEM7_9SPHN|nr:hypothetical protein [Sphingobium boeckii]MBB5684239.1 hypothetical protein [Sphingobium boeckii]